MKTVLLCGHRAYAARGLAELLQGAGYRVLCFSRGAEKRNGNVVTGNVLNVGKNPYLCEERIDIVINFIMLKDGSAEDNISYISALCQLAVNKHVERFVHLSSISSYPNDVKVITDETEMDCNANLKGGYGARKVVVDAYLMQQRDSANLPVILIRPGFITAADHPNPLAGIVKVLFGNVAILMGDSNSTLPLISRDEMHRNLLRVLEIQHPRNVYVLVSDGKSTKATYAKSVNANLKLIGLPQRLVTGIAIILKVLHLLDERKLQMIRGQFKVQHVVPSNL